MPNNQGSTILILGGTAEAHALAQQFVAAGHRVVSSLAGRTADPALPAGEVRVGGFGGSEGLARYLVEHGIARVVDATHPFASRISENARIACRKTGVPLEVLDRPEWERKPGDNWITAADLDAAAAVLTPGAKVFLALGRQYLAAFESRKDCHFVVRMVDPSVSGLSFASAELVLGKPSTDPADETRLFLAHGITHLVCRNSGGAAGYGKIAAARALGLPVVMVQRAS